tara:strand:- start:1118 stop:1291 length:174 start_codon:yes stop_codon:yes gene_type:complete
MIPSKGFKGFTTENIKENILKASGHEMHVKVELCKNLTLGRTSKWLFIHLFNSIISL